MSTWTATIEDKTKSVLAFSTTITGAKLTLPLNDTATLDADFAIDGVDTAAILSQLASGPVFIRFAEDGTTRFFGQLATLQTSISDDATLSTSWTDLAGPYDNLLQFDGRYKTSGLSSKTTNIMLNYMRPSEGVAKTIYVTVPANGQTPNQIVDILLGGTSGSLPWPALDRDVALQLTRSGSVTSPGRTLDMTNKSVLECLKALGNLANGIDWYVEPDQTFKMASSLGTDKSMSVVFDLSDTNLRNVSSVTVSYLPPRNRIYMTGDDGLTRRIGYDSASVTKYGAFEYMADAVDNATRTESDVGDQKLRPNWRQVIELTVEPTIAPNPWVNYYLGDTVQVNIVRSSYSYSGKQRVNQIAIEFNDELAEVAHNLTFEVI